MKIFNFLDQIKKIYININIKIFNNELWTFILITYIFFRISDFEKIYSKVYQNTTRLYIVLAHVI